ncbi:unnamed protein product [Paramecium sonneborni]|uniref:MORN repeat protein n=1 Tax=Paramecium sonneborni TaxID=65129 RepID=A0A8S1RS31_9CILI|nr:unnamed protein product [Paramecium sonneborni]
MGNYFYGLKDVFLYLYKYKTKVVEEYMIHKASKLGIGWYQVIDFKSCSLYYFQLSKSQVIYHGQYIKGKRFGRWDISFKDESFEKPERIGGGLFNEYGQKYGKWTEISDKFDDDNQFIFEGYYKNGKKQGLWDLCNNQEWIYIGEGSL